MSFVGDIVSSVVGGVENTVSGAVSGVGDILSGQIGKGLGELGPAALSLGTMAMTGGFDPTMIAEDAASLSAQGLGADQIASTLAQSYGIDSMAAADAAGLATQGLGASDIAANLSQSLGMAANPSSATNLGSLLGYAKTGSQIIGGLGQLAGGVSMMNKSGQLQQQADPFAQYRPGYASQLANLMANPNSVTQTPGYQFNLAQGLQSMQAQQAAQGRLVSGGALLQANQFGQNLASQTYADQLKTLSSLSGATQSPAAGTQATVGAMNATAGGFQGALQGLGNVINPLQTLYANYNSGTPTIQG
jgi:hypothetical protein